jgi:hypothetical protein
MGRDALAKLSREQLIELVLALAAEVAELKARQGQPPTAPGDSSVPPPRSSGQAGGSRRIGLSVGRGSTGAGTFWLRRLLRGHQDALPAPLEAGAECYAGCSSFLYSRMSPG